MNELLNIIYLFFTLGVALPKISELTKNPLYIKLLIIVAVLGLETIFDAISRIINQKKLSIVKILDKSLMNGLLVLLGFMLFSDLQEISEVVNMIPGFSELLKVKEAKVIVMILPILLFTTSKCFLKAY